MATQRNMDYITKTILWNGIMKLTITNLLRFEVQDYMFIPNLDIAHLVIGDASLQLEMEMGSQEMMMSWQTFTIVWIIS